MTDFNIEKPKLRALDFQPVEYEGSSYLMVRDPLLLHDQPLFVPQEIIPLLVLSDGTRDLTALRGALLLQYGLRLSLEHISQNLTVLDSAYLLENSNFRGALDAAQRAYRGAPFRPPACAGSTYPQEAAALRQQLKGYLDALAPAQPVAGSVRGLLSPHIDYQRGGPIYARTWGPVQDAVRAAGLAVIFGTDHYSEGLPVSLTRQSYASPLGVLPTALDIVDTLAEQIGPDLAFAGELHHRREHSIELAAVWMQHVRQGQPLETVPILIGALESAAGLNQSFVATLLGVLSQAIQGRRVLVVAAGDLAHIGPAFETPPVDAAGRRALERSDANLIDAICQGDAEGFRALVQESGDANNICGLWPIYLTLRLLAPTGGQALGYDICPADDTGSSVVSIGGVAFH